MSLEPELTTLEFQANAPILLKCPEMVVNFFILTVSQIWTSPELVPIPSIGPLTLQATEVTESFNPMSHSFNTFEVTALHRYTLEPSPTAR